MKRYLMILVVVGVLVTGLRAFPGATRNTKGMNQDYDDGLDTVLIFEDGRPSDPFFRDPFSLKPVDRGEESDTPHNSWNFSPFRHPELNFDGLIARMMAQLNQLLSRVPPIDKFSPGIDIPEGSNTTSETKVVDGHVVTVNETTYNHVNGTHTAIFRLKIVDVQPQNETVIGEGAKGEVEEVTMTSEIPTTEKSMDEKSSTESRSVETFEDFSDNEIPNKKVKNL